MKTAEELNALKEEIETLNTKLLELSEEELKVVIGGQEHRRKGIGDDHIIVVTTPL